MDLTMLDVVLKISIWLNAIRSLPSTYGSIGTECINGSYRTLGISEGKPQVTPLVNQLKYVDDQVVICCSVKANPAARILWLYEGKVITGERDGQLAYRYTSCNETLTIKYVMLSDAGRYTCQVTNARGEASSTGVLQVKIRDKSLRRPNATISRKQPPCRGGNVTLSCENNAGESYCSWYKNDQMIEVTREDRYCGRSCHLLFHNFSRENEGLYKCEVGDLKANLTLAVDQSEECGEYNSAFTVSCSRFRSHGAMAVLSLVISFVLVNMFMLIPVN